MFRENNVTRVRQHVVQVSWESTWDAAFSLWPRAYGLQDAPSPLHTWLRVQSAVPSPEQEIEGMFSGAAEPNMNWRRAEHELSARSASAESRSMV